MKKLIILITSIFIFICTAKAYNVITPKHNTMEIVHDSLKTSSYHLVKAGENLMAAKITFITTAMISLIITYNLNENTAYVVGVGTVVGTIIEIIGVQHLIRAGQKLEKNKKIKLE